MKKTLIALTLAAASSAHAGFYTGNDILRRLNGDEVSKSVAMYYIAGVADTLQGALVCAPAEVTLGQLMDMTQHYLNASPTTRHQAADLLITRMLTAIWPCPDKKGTAL